MAFTPYESTLTSATNGANVPVFGDAVLSVWGTFSATVRLRRSHDNGTTWVPVSRDSAGTPLDLTVPATIAFTEPCQGILYDLDCTSYASGTVNWRIEPGAA
jgi:hypothetical protein